MCQCARTGAASNDCARIGFASPEAPESMPSAGSRERLSLMRPSDLRLEGTVVVTGSY
jgi:hypothetical protein